jgi:hypothetical protein
MRHPTLIQRRAGELIMSINLRESDRDQLFLLPPSVADWLPSDHLAFFVLDVVAEFDLVALGDRRAVFSSAWAVRARGTRRVSGDLNRRHQDRGERLGMEPHAPSARRRGGNVTMRIENHADTKTLHGFIKSVVSDDAEATYTDDLAAYNGIADENTRHETVNHSAKEYVHGDVHTTALSPFGRCWTGASSVRFIR